LTPSFEENHLGTEFRHKDFEVLVAAHREEFVILVCIVFEKQQSVSDGRTGRQRDERMDAKTKPLKSVLILYFGLRPNFCLRLKSHM